MMKKTSLEERQAECRQHGHSWIGSYPRHCSWCQVSESVSGGEATLRAKNIPSMPPPDLDNAYELTQAIAQAEAAQQTPRPVFGDPQWIERTRPKVAPGRCVIEINGKRV